MLGSLDGALKINCFYNDITGGINFLFLHYIFEESDFNHPQNIQVTKNETSLLILFRGGTQEFELRCIKFKKYISGLRSIFWFQKKHNFA